MEVKPVLQESHLGLSQVALDLIASKLQALRTGVGLEKVYHGEELAELRASPEARAREIAELEAQPERARQKDMW